MKILHCITFVLIIVGALNWGLVGIFNFDLVATIFGEMTTLSKVVYTLVGLSAVFEVVSHKKNCKACKACESK